MRKKLILIVALTIVASLAVAGCTTSTNTSTSGSTSQLQQYANAFHNFTLSTLGPDESITGWQQNSNGSNGMIIQWVQVNTTLGGGFSTPGTGPGTTIFGPNGTQTNVSINLEQFPSTAAASSFFINESGLNSTLANSSVGIWNPPQEVYKQATGNNVTVANSTYSYQVSMPLANAINGNISMTITGINFIVQQNEFVYWGTASVQPL